jgi:hypothetical protein
MPCHFYQIEIGDHALGNSEKLRTEPLWSYFSRRTGIVDMPKVSHLDNYPSTQAPASQRASVTISPLKIPKAA